MAKLTTAEFIEAIKELSVLEKWTRGRCVLSDYCSDSRDDKKNRDEWVVSA